MGVPHTLQNLSVGLATVPHCAHALMVSPFVAFCAPTVARTGEHIESRAERGALQGLAPYSFATPAPAAARAARTTSRTGTPCARAAAAHASNSGLSCAGPKGPSATFTGIGP